jgi:hypothetical protein
MDSAGVAREQEHATLALAYDELGLKERELLH